MSSTIANTIAVAKVTSVLASNDIAKGNLFPTTIRTEPRFPLMITTERVIIEGVYNRIPDYPGLQEAADYLYDLCGRYRFQAQSIVNGTGGGSVVPPVGPSLPNIYDFEIAIDSSPLAEGEDTVILTNFIGYNLDFNRNNTPQNSFKPTIGGSYYNWDRTTGRFQCFPAAMLGESFQIIPVG